MAEEEEGRLAALVFVRDTNRREWPFEGETASLLDGSLLLGDQSAAEEPALLLALGVTAVVSLTDHDELAYDKPGIALRYAELGLKRFHLSLQDQPGADIEPMLEPARLWAEQEMRAGGRVLVHCAAGVSRSPSLVTYVLMHADPSPPDPLLRAFEKVCLARRVHPQVSFLRQLVRAETRLLLSNNQ
jgi:protein-tyrosine phosphatase